MTLLAIDWEVLQAVRQRDQLDRLFRQDESFWLMDFVEWGILDRSCLCLKEWRARNELRLMHVETSFTGAFIIELRAWVLAGRPAGLRPQPDFGLLAAWSAARIAEDVRAGRLAPDTYEVLAEQEQAAALLVDAGVTVRNAAWASSR